MRVTVMAAMAAAAAVWLGVCGVQARITCEQPDYATCLKYETAAAGGIQLQRYCARQAGTQRCVDDAPLNQCKTLAASLKCTQASKTCVDYQNGACRQTRFAYACLNEDEDMSPAVLKKTEFGPTEEEIVNRCDELEIRKDCELEETSDIEGAGVRKINGKEFSRSWWTRKRTYSCLAQGEGDTTCGPLESDPTCTLQGSSCLVKRNGICTNREFHYRCGAKGGSLQTSCAPINVCAGGVCMGVEQETSDGFASSAAWLNVLAEMQKDYRDQAVTDPNDVRFFQGRMMTCSKAPGRNCCGDGGIFGSSCPESASVLADKRAAGSTHYVGVTCQQKVLGACVKKRYYYCTYNSKFARVFVEEYKKQISQSWGSPGGADCGDITIEDFGNADIEAMDLSPVFGDVMEQVTLPVTKDLQDFYEDRFPGAGQDVRDTFEELGQ